MNIEWDTDLARGTARLETAGRVVNVEKTFGGYSVWYGPPGRRLCLGRFDTMPAAKTVAEDLVGRLASLNTFLEEH